MTEDVARSDEDWRRQLSPEQYAVCRCGATEPPFTGRYWNTKTKGTYRCACCRQPLFHSSRKFDSGTGWPSYWEAAAPEAIAEKRDTSHGMVRIEALCSKCGAHLGHVFPDGPPPTGLRYCINSASLQLEAEE